MWESTKGIQMNGKKKITMIDRVRTIFALLEWTDMKEGKKGAVFES